MPFPTALRDCSLVLALVGATAAVPAMAHADLGSFPDGGPCGFYSIGLVPTSGTVPSDAAQVIIVSPSPLPITTANVFVTQIDAGGTETVVPFTLEMLDSWHTAVHPAGPLAAGVSLHVAVQPCAALTDMTGWPSTTLTIAPPSTPPTTLGPLHVVVPPAPIVPVLVTYQLVATLDAAAVGAYGDAWNGAFAIDGVAYGGAPEQPLSVFASPSGDHIDVLLTCAGYPGPGGLVPISGGHHTLRILGGPWGYPRVADSDTVDVELTCPPLPVFDAGSPSLIDGGLRDAGPMDAGDATSAPHSCSVTAAGAPGPERRESVAYLVVLFSLTWLRRARAFARRRD